MSYLVYTIGDNENGQQADGTDKDVEELQRIELLNQNVNINTIVTGGEGSTYILLNNGCMIVFGYDEYGQLGVDYQRIKNIVLHFYRNTGLTQILSLDIEMIIITFCNKFDGRNEAQMTPLLIDTFNIKSISKGICSRHRFLITTNNEIYASGWNKWNQCGPSTNSYAKITKYVQKNTEFNMWRKITHFMENKKTVKQIECSWRYSLFLTTNGNIYRCGASSYDSSITKMDCFWKIQSICCGMEHSLALAISGEVISFGQNDLGQLGYGTNIKSINFPVSITYFDENNIIVKQIACGECHNIALDLDGKIYCWGRNICYECGGIDNKNLYIPKLNCLSFPQTDIKIIDIKCGSYHNVVKSEDNQYYFWGWNEYSQCLEYEYEYCKRPRKLNISSSKVIDVYPGHNETRIVTNMPLTMQEIKNPTIKIKF